MRNVRSNADVQAAGTYPGVLTAAYTPNANYEVTVTPADFEIGKRAVTLTSATDSKAWDGTALTNHDVTVTGDGFAAGEGADYAFTGTQTDPGASDNAFTYELNGGAVAANYDVSTVFGTLTVNPVVTFAMNGHGAAISAQTVALGGTAEEPEAPSETGWTFGGWYTDDGTFNNAAVVYSD